MGDRVAWLIVRPRLIDGERQLIECNSNSVVDWCVGGDVVVAASEVLGEGVTGGEDPR